MSSIGRLTFSALALGLILLLTCYPSARAAFASRDLHFAQAPENHSPAYKDGMVALRDSNYEQAAGHFQQAAADKPDDMWAPYYFGLCLLNLKRFDEAVNAYQQALTLQPKVAPVHYQLAKIYLAMGDREAVEKEHRWLQENDQELALYLSDLLPSDKPLTQQNQDASVRSTIPQPQDKLTPGVEPMNKDLRPTIMYREKAKYTEIARTNRVQGTVVLQVVFANNGELQGIRVVRGLPDGLTRKAIEATQNIRFNPATRDGVPVSVRGQLEFSFNIY